MSRPARIRLEDRGSGVRALVMENLPHNALTTAMCEQGVELLTQLAADSTARVLVMTGEGTQFCSGADLAEMRAGLDPTIPFGALLDALNELPIPTIAAIDGAAAGGGVEIALACDLRVASGAATFTASAVNVGLFAGWHRLPRLIGLSLAAEMVLTGQRYGVDDLSAWGLVRVSGPDGVHRDAEELALRIASRAPLSVRVLVPALRGSFDMDRPAASRYQSEIFAQLQASADHSEAVAAFLEKRPPDFMGR